LGGGDMFGGAISTAVGPISGRLVTADFNVDGKVDIGVRTLSRRRRSTISQSFSAMGKEPFVQQAQWQARARRSRVT